MDIWHIKNGIFWHSDEGRAKIAEQALYLFNIDPRYLGRSIEKVDTSFSYIFLVFEQRNL